MYVAIHVHESELCQTVLVGIAFLYLAGALAPLDVHALVALCQIALHAVCLDGEVHQIAALMQGVVEVNIAIGTCAEAHGNCGVCAMDRGEIVIFCLDCLTRVIKKVVHLHVFVTEERHRCGLVLFLIVLQHGAVERAAFCVEGQLKYVIANGYLLVGTLGSIEKGSRAVNYGNLSFIGKGSFLLGP